MDSESVTMPEKSKQLSKSDGRKLISTIQEEENRRVDEMRNALRQRKAGDHIPHLKKMVARLRYFNAWRRGDPNHASIMPDPREVGEAIDALCDAVEQLTAERDALLADKARLVPEGDFYLGIEWLGCCLIDHCEGEVITEEQMRAWAVRAWNKRIDAAKGGGR